MSEHYELRWRVGNNQIKTGHLPISGNRTQALEFAQSEAVKLFNQDHSLKDFALRGPCGESVPIHVVSEK